MTSLIEQSSKAYLENKIIKQIEYGVVDCSQNRMRDNILVQLKEEDSQVPFIEEDESAISELDAEDAERDFSKDLNQFIAA